MPRLEFEGFKINLNSVLLLTQLLAGVLVGAGVLWRGSTSDVDANRATIARHEKMIESLMIDLREVQKQAVVTAVIRADMNNMQSALARIEHKLEGK